MSSGGMGGQYGQPKPMQYGSAYGNSGPQGMYTGGPNMQAPGQGAPQRQTGGAYSESFIDTATPPPATGPGVYNGPTNLYRQGPTAGMTPGGPAGPGNVSPVPPWVLGQLPGANPGQTTGGNTGPQNPTNFQTATPSGGDPMAGSYGRQTGGQNFESQGMYTGGPNTGPQGMFTGGPNTGPQGVSQTPNQNAGINDTYSRFGLDPASNGGAWWTNAINSGQMTVNDLATALNSQRGQANPQGMNKPLMMDKGPGAFAGQGTGAPYDPRTPGYQPGAGWQTMLRQYAMQDRNPMNQYVNDRRLTPMWRDQQQAWEPTPAPWAYRR